MKFEELKQKKQWGVYRLKDNEKTGRKDKIPVDPTTGIRGNQNKPETWVTHFVANCYCTLKHYKSKDYKGLSVYMGNGLWLLDIDNIRADIDDYQSGNPKANNKVVAARKLTKGSYAEVSVSGNGIHILFIYNGKEPHRREKLNGIELYSNGRHCAMTFNSLDPIENDVQELTADDLLKLIEFYGLNEPKARTPTKKPSLPCVDLNNGDDLTADEVIKKLEERYSQGYNRQRVTYPLFKEGNWQALNFASQSEADLSLCNDLAFWSNKNPYVMDEVFRQSALYRPKWDRLATDRATSMTYGEITIQKAISGTNGSYTKKKKDLRYKFGFN